jgi:hypothetical protein
LPREQGIETFQAIARMKIESLADPVYSPEFSQSDFSFFGSVKTALQNRRFADADAVVEALTALVDRVTFDELRSGLQN